MERLNQQSVELHSVEFVERKGLGHPDYIADSLSEEFSLQLCKVYKERFGQILHHNVDKVLLVGGQANVRFGGGEVLTPIYILMSGRATTEVSNNGVKEYIPVGRVAVESAKNWIRENLRFLNPETHVIVDHRVGKGSADLVCNYEARRENKCSNDTSFGVAYAPLDSLERVVYETERFVNSPYMRKRLPEVGEDVKVMGLRSGREIKLTLAVAMVSKLIPDLDHYISVKEQLKKELEDFVAKKSDLPVEIYLNNADRPDLGVVYITVTGTSAEMGDDGETGRGNRVNGLITPSRPMSLEATAGKNPVSHIGKIYNVMAVIIANKVAELKGVKEAYVKIVSQIGRPIDDPHMTNVQLLLEGGSVLTSGLQSEIESIVNEEFDQIDKITEGILQRKFTLY
ncbi:MAG: methionine adenosyltransferase [Candidatus Verstraetearchaeota archaeon]|uniref:Methionine adenosyltransferase n=1 Tax=Thermoproteota archaeon TaxID=2056631 RepID=A0A523BFV2_9CREN|nr:methionine adenosyltransferase [Candidatus Verstraetearchaeota archaeon]TDA39818.1 MAG: methionine adenosyltransferase [Candidatus Verstraetearchaeota archaeon]